MRRNFLWEGLNGKNVALDDSYSEEGEVVELNTATARFQLPPKAFEALAIAWLRSEGYMVVRQDDLLAAWGRAAAEREERRRDEIRQRP
jgi:hypothetical protein